MPEPSEKELQRMQRDAEQRMREMQRRTAQFSHGHDTPQVPNFVRLSQQQTNRRPKPDNRPATTQQPDARGQSGAANKSQKPLNRGVQNSSHGTLNKGFNLLRMFNFENFKLDSDITIIIVLILLISSEETDELLLLALAYIML
ncbi:MAG: hypothetical protein E7525_01190 [Ruminococcaceae bacterium]|nr:hypothetical protein [Oscillospiraceae bacterium]